MKYQLLRRLRQEGHLKLQEFKTSLGKIVRTHLNAKDKGKKLPVREMLPADWH
jgi:hypothetical protein